MQEPEETETPIVESKIKRYGKKLWKFTKRFFLVLGILIVIYLFSAYILSRITIEGKDEKNANIEIWLMKSGVHTDFVVPVKTKIKDWSKEFPIENTNAKDTTTPLIAIGWGDKNFYMNTPTWADLTFKTAVSAMAGLGSSSIHATYFYNILSDRPVISLKLSENQYRKLVKYIEGSLYRNKQNKAIFIQPRWKTVMGQNDAYYEARNNYSIFTTCNSWINSGLKAADKKACLWTPFAGGIFYQYGK
jgi:uncharacterized protein (TIGR02117 family)